MTILLTGFGPFPGVEANPSAELARGIDGLQIAGHVVVGRVLPVSYTRAVAETLEAARSLDARLVLGTGVAVRRARPALERVGRRVEVGSPDVDGVCETGMDGPPLVPSTLDVACLAQALDAGLSEDAGRYVCNTWLYQVSYQLSVPVGFLHIPAEGFEVERLASGLRSLLQPGPGSS